MSKKRVIIRIIIVVWLCLIWGHSLQPATVSEEESGFFLEYIGKIFPFLLTSDIGMFLVRKTAHFIEYLILGILLCIDTQHEVRGFFKRFSVPTMIGLMIAFIDETIQLFVIGRSGEVRDMWIDFAGVALGALITLAISGNKGGRRY